MMVRARLLVSLDRQNVGDQAGKGDPNWFTGNAGCRAEELPGELTWRQVQAELEGEDTVQAGRCSAAQGRESARLSQGDDVEAGRRGQEWERIGRKICVGTGLPIAIGAWEGGVDNCFYHPEWTRQQGTKQHPRQRRLIQWLLSTATSFYW